MEPNILAHGGGGDLFGTLGVLAGIAPALFGGILLIYFVLLTLGDRKSDAHDEGVRDETPTAGRLIFSGEYAWSRLMLEADIQAHFKALEPARPAEGRRR